MGGLSHCNNQQRQNAVLLDKFKRRDMFSFFFLSFFFGFAINSLPMRMFRLIVGPNRENPALLPMNQSWK